MSTLVLADAPAADDYATVYLAFELSLEKWKLGVILPGAKKMSRFEISGGDLAALSKRLTAARASAGASGKPIRILSCYEAGLDAHWLHRWLTDQGVVSHEIDPSSIEVNRRARRAKTDRIDLARLMRAFLSYLRGEPEACKVVHVPSVEEEDRKRRDRERDRLLKEQTGHSNRIKTLLLGQGIRNVEPLKKGFLESLPKLRTGDGRALPQRLTEEIVREHERLCLVHQQLVQLDVQTRAELRAAAPASPEARIAQLIDLKGLGQTSAYKLYSEALYRSFDNRRQVGSYFGLTGTPHDSGKSHREQGISKAGNRRARTLAIELAWLWRRHQPDSELTRWFEARVRGLKGRVRRITIVALARKLMVALWRYLQFGVVPNGAVLHPSI
jgi:transposase